MYRNESIDIDRGPSTLPLHQQRSTVDRLPIYVRSAAGEEPTSTLDFEICGTSDAVNPRQQRRHFTPEQAASWAQCQRDNYASKRPLATDLLVTQMIYTPGSDLYDLPIALLKHETIPVPQDFRGAVPRSGLSDDENLLAVELFKRDGGHSPCPDYMRIIYADPRFKSIRKSQGVITRALNKYRLNDPGSYARQSQAIGANVQGMSNTATGTSSTSAVFRWNNEFDDPDIAFMKPYVDALPAFETVPSQHSPSGRSTLRRKLVPRTMTPDQMADWLAQRRAHPHLTTDRLITDLRHNGDTCVTNVKYGVLTRVLKAYPIEAPKVPLTKVRLTHAQNQLLFSLFVVHGTDLSRDEMSRLILSDDRYATLRSVSENTLYARRESMKPDVERIYREADMPELVPPSNTLPSDTTYSDMPEMLFEPVSTSTHATTSGLQDADAMNSLWFLNPLRSPRQYTALASSPSPSPNDDVPAYI